MHLDWLLGVFVSFSGSISPRLQCMAGVVVVQHHDSNGGGVGGVRFTILDIYI